MGELNWRYIVSARSDKRVLKIAVIALAVVEAIAMVPVVLHLVNR